MLYETSTHYCASHYFDPFPSTGHVLLFGLIPLSNFLTWLASRRDLSNHFAAMALVSGMAMGVGVLYTLMFLPLTAASCYAIALFGFGLFGLAPLLSLPCSWLGGKAVCRMAHAKATYFSAHQVEHIGHMIILVMVLAVELPSTMTRVNLCRATQSNAGVASDAVAWLRKYGSTEVLQRACYERSGRATDILGSMYENAHPITSADARRVFYRVTGKPFNSVPIAAGARATIRRANVITEASNLNAGVADEFDFDDAIAGESVAGVARGLSAAKSKIDCAIEANAALATVNMSFDLVNVSKIDREARAKIELPPNAVITAAYLDVDGKNFEADISVRNAARAQYQANVQARKAPLLVSMVGADCAMLQCYPVRPEHPLRVTLKLAVPLTVLDGGRGRLTMPTFAEKNFAISDPTEIASTIDGKPQPLIAASGATLNRFGSDITVDRDAGMQMARADIDKYVTNSVVERILKPTHYRRVKNIWVLLDTSSPMQPYLSSILKGLEGLKSLPAGLSCHVRFIGDSDRDEDYKAALASLKNLKATGGQDDAGAVENAVELTSKAHDGSIVLWIHGPQPQGLDSQSQAKESMRKTLGASYLRPLLFDLPVEAANNPLLEGIYAPHGLVRVARSASLEEDIVEFFHSCLPETKADTAQLEKAEATEKAVAQAMDFSLVPTQIANEYDSHPREALTEATSADPKIVRCDARLAQIWANRQLGYNHDAPSTSSSSGSAGDDTRLIGWHIVSPISSAIISQTALPQDLQQREALKQKGEEVKKSWTFDPDAMGDKLSALQKDLQAGLEPGTQPQYKAKEAYVTQGATAEDHDLLGRKIDAMHVSTDNLKYNQAGQLMPLDGNSTLGGGGGSTDAFQSLGRTNASVQTAGSTRAIEGFTPSVNESKTSRLDNGDPRFHPPHQTNTNTISDQILLLLIALILAGTMFYYYYYLRNRKR